MPRSPARRHRAWSPARRPGPGLRRGGIGPRHGFRHGSRSPARRPLPGLCRIGRPRAISRPAREKKRPAWGRPRFRVLHGVALEGLGPPVLVIHVSRLLPAPAGAAHWYSPARALSHEGARAVKRHFDLTHPLRLRSIRRRGIVPHHEVEEARNGIFQRQCMCQWEGISTGIQRRPSPVRGPPPRTSNLASIVRLRTATRRRFVLTRGDLADVASSIHRGVPMAYANADELLPPELLREVQKYIQGCLLYVPRSGPERLGWGSRSGARGSRFAQRRDPLRQGLRPQHRRTRRGPWPLARRDPQDPLLPQARAGKLGALHIPARPGRNTFRQAKGFPPRAPLFQSFAGRVSDLHSACADGPKPSGPDARGTDGSTPPIYAAGFNRNPGVIAAPLKAGVDTRNMARSSGSSWPASRIGDAQKRVLLTFISKPVLALAERDKKARIRGRLTNSL